MKYLSLALFALPLLTAAAPVENALANAVEERSVDYVDLSRREAEPVGPISGILSGRR